jgi:hypothetical protein
MNKHIFTISIFLCVSFFAVLPFEAKGSIVKPNPREGTFGTNQEVPVQIILDTEQRKVNTVSASLRLPNNVKVSVSDGNSIISRWIDAPTIINNTIHFSGIIPGGYQGSDGLLVTLLVNSTNTGGTSVSFPNLPVILLNDGKGTPDQVKVMAGYLNFASNGEVITPEIDTTPPEPFSVTIIRDRNLYNNQYVAIFQTQDKGSGIDHYEVSESETGTPNDWKTVSSPYLLGNQTRDQYLHVKAVDRAGNERLSIVTPLYERPFLERIMWPIGLVIGILLIFTLLRWANHVQVVKGHYKRHFGQSR